MSGARFARTGRFRLFAGFFVILLLVGIMAMYTSTIQCENNIETLRRQAENQRYQMERVKEQETNKLMESQRNLEEKLKEQREQQEKDLLDMRLNLDQLQETHNILKIEHSQLVDECAKSKKQQLDDANSLEKKLQALRSELKKAKTLQENEIALWKEKFNAVVKEKTQLESQAGNNKTDQEKRMKLLESIVAEFSSNCVYKPKTSLSDLIQLQQQQQINDPLSPPETTHNVGKGAGMRVQLPSFDKPKNDKNFRAQESIVPKPLKKLSVEETQETQLKQQQPEDAAEKAAVVVGKVSPLSAPRKLTSTQSAKAAQRVLEQANNASISISTSSSTSSLPPLMLPPNQRKQLPAGVAPIPEYDQLLKDEAEKQQQQQQESPKKKTAAAEHRDAGDIDAAIEQHENDEQQQEGTNNRYANVVNDLDAKKRAKLLALPANNVGGENQNDDMGAREVKDNEAPLANEPHFNLPADEDENNFFDAGDKNDAAAGGAGGGGEAANANNVNDGKHKNNDDNNDDDDDLGLVGADIAVKNHNLLEADSLNNEVAGDQGKEFPDGLRIEDVNEEDEDEDEYANLAARQQGAQAIRN